METRPEVTCEPELRTKERLIEDWPSVKTGGLFYAACPGKNVWMMGGGEVIGSFLDEDAIDEFIMVCFSG